ncbi:hypothetical protein ACIHAX_13270 [Nocardia sp. NPDC051929]|uniref:hypothetical protein n=1 Tax=Nocardia sp. NPDC051929 TaxID=3364327 RepID=UPI0037C97A6D
MRRTYGDDDLNSKGRSDQRETDDVRSIFDLLYIVYTQRRRAHRYSGGVPIGLSEDIAFTMLEAILAEPGYDPTSVYTRRSTCKMCSHAATR